MRRRNRSSPERSRGELPRPSCPDRGSKRVAGGGAGFCDATGSAAEDETRPAEAAEMVNGAAIAALLCRPCRGGMIKRLLVRWLRSFLACHRLPSCCPSGAMTTGYRFMIQRLLAARVSGNVLSLMAVGKCRA